MPERKTFKNKLMKATATVAVILVICTFLSRTVETLTLPLVEVAGMKELSLDTTISVKGKVNYEQKQIISFDFPVKILKVQVKANQEITPEDVLFEVDADTFMLELERKQLAVVEAENAVYDARWSSQRVRDVYDRQLSIAKHELDLFERQYPLDGKIRAKQAGIVSKLNVKEGELVPVGIALAETYSVNTPIYAKFVLPQQESRIMSSGAKATIQYEIDRKKASQSMNVPPGVFDEEKNGYVFSLDMENVVLQDGQEVDITLTKSVPQDDLAGAIVIPKSALSETDGDLKVYILRQRDGIFGEEDYVQEITVTKLDENASFAAVLSEFILPDTKIIVNTNKPLKTGRTVRRVWQ